MTYGAHKFHPYHTLSSHFYISRPLFAHRPSLDSWPEDLRTALYQATRDAVLWQRQLSEQEVRDARQLIEDEGCLIEQLTAAEQQAFVGAVKPQHDDARERFGDTIFQHANL